MKKFLTLSLLLASFALTATFASAQTGRYANEQNGYQQDRRNDRDRRDDRNDRDDQNRRGNFHGVRVVTQTRTVRDGRHFYRETIRIKYLPNGRTQTQVISRTRIR